MLEQACSYLRQHIDSGGADFVVSVNFSRVTLYTQGFLPRCWTLGQVPPAPPVRGAGGDRERVQRHCRPGSGQADRLAAKKGFSVSMDDFGTGYSSLNLLDKLPIQVLKLDKEFLRKTAGRSG